MGEKMAFFCGAQGNKFLFSSENKLPTSWWPQSMKKALLFPEFVESSLKEVSALKRSFLHDILKPEALKQYIPLMDAMGREHLDENWVSNGVVKVFPLSKKYTFDLACRLFTTYNRAIKGGKMVRDELMRIITQRRKELMEN
ncbi:hypothetical protein K7X08_004276 [Anisodus acutangulus]|uniref:Uncharacterized protein n=1 Tax=Anisodus acutangulus TaxID=402998 RepID=A0A9Q1RHA4_9SOLA|nr:hypothetical protein K7X08_004276 [Anisodus acutangulus]